MYAVFRFMLLAIPAASFIVEVPDPPPAEGYIPLSVPSTEAELAPFTILRTSSKEDLEEYLSFGYPAPELQAILEDESIPEEDRYWLDCRMRSAVAQLLHRFYDRNGNMIEVEAEWIASGEPYWQEIMMVYPPVPERIEPELRPGEIRVAPRTCCNGHVELRATGPALPESIESGLLYNLYGEETGHLIVLPSKSRVSRTGSVATTRTATRPGNSAVNLCFMYGDGTYRIANARENHPGIRAWGNLRLGLSMDGSIAVLCGSVRTDSNRYRSTVIVFDSSGREIESYEMPCPFALTAYGTTVSPNNKYIACAGTDFGRGISSGSVIINRETGEVRHYKRASGRAPYFSENSRFCVLTGCIPTQSSYVIDLEDESCLRVPNSQAVAGEINIGSSSVCNNPRILAFSGRVFVDADNVFSTPDLDSSTLSPNGYFCINSTNGSVYGASCSMILLNLSSFLEEGQ
ncbi:hypothetical protein CSA37_08520 [Candidatus Fermentibacteria bacterium]|nr:MAG: hypothetical protein CSA37_08520 [Candidatus Fermentibacteria bacterium]